MKNLLSSTNNLSVYNLNTKQFNEKNIIFILLKIDDEENILKNLLKINKLS